MFLINCLITLINFLLSNHEEEIRNNCTSNTFKSGNPNMKISEMEDLIYLTGPLTEDAVMKSLQARFNEKKFFVSSFLCYCFIHFLAHFSDVLCCFFMH